VPSVFPALEAVFKSGAGSDYDFTVLYQPTERINRQVLVWRGARIGYREKQ
jgi:hypothetical protein